MTSERFNREREERRRQQFIFDRLPSAIRAALNACAESPPRPSIVRDALLRGVSEQSLIELISRKKESKDGKVG